MAQTVNKPLLKNASENWLFKIANQRRFFMLITNKLPAGLSKSFLRALQKGHFHNRFDLWTLLMLCTDCQSNDSQFFFLLKSYRNPMSITIFNQNTSYRKKNQASGIWSITTETKV